jgi:ankyrin repeat protein
VPLLVTPATINMYDRRNDGGTPSSAAAAGGHMETVEALLAAGADPGGHNGHSNTPLSMAVQHGHRQVVRVLLKALVDKYLQQQTQAPPQQQQVQDNRQQQQQQPGGQGALLSATREEHTFCWLVAGALRCAAGELLKRPGCCQLLELVLNQLGPGWTARVCQEAQRQLQERPPLVSRWWREFSGTNRRDSYLAGVLLLCWLGAEGRRRIPARLQRLVPGVGGTQQQQQQNPGQRQVHAQPEQLVQEAVLAVVCGRVQQAAALLGGVC